MDKIEIGEYVKTKDGIIAKCIDFIEDNFYFFDKVVDRSYEEVLDFICKENISTMILKHSQNIIDLIEVGDIVELVDVLSKEVIYIWDEEMLKAVKQDIEEGQTLKSILTHEQFNQNKYEVEGEK